MSHQAPDELQLFLSRDQIRERVLELGAVISRDFAGRPLLLIGMLKGAAIFLADLLRAISLDSTYDFVSVSSYGTGLRSSGAVRILGDLPQSLEGRSILLVEDILDTGLTLRFLRDTFLARGPAMLKIAVLLDKPSRRIQPIDADYTGFTVPDRFIVGYGMDAAERYRNLPDIYFLSGDI